MSNKILVIGGAGYIGSHCVLTLKEQGYQPVVVDNFSTGDRKIAQALDVQIVEGDISSYDFCVQTLKQHSPKAVMHFAAFAYVGESVTDPFKYYQNNLSATITLLKAMVDTNVKKFIFSSTCATYGIPKIVPINEQTPQDPINPYGKTKLFVEHVLKDFQHAYGLEYVIFRYFNAAGAHPSGLIGEIHNPETHLIPLAIFSAQGKEELKIFGNDYETPDGTCIRDYIHVCDIAKAHVLGVQYLEKNTGSQIFNIGNGQGYSVLEVIQAVEKACGNKVKYKFSDRRAGDPPRLVAAADKIINTLGFKPEYPGLDEIVKSAWSWHKKN